MIFFFFFKPLACLSPRFIQQRLCKCESITHPALIQPTPVVMKTHAHLHTCLTHTHTRTIIKCYLEIFPWLKREKEMPRRWQLIRLDVFVTQGEKKGGKEKKNLGRLNVLVCVMREAAHVCAWACKPREGRRCSLKRPRQPSALNHPRSARRHQQRKHITRVVSPRLLLLSSLYYI